MSYAVIVIHWVFWCIAEDELDSCLILDERRTSPCHFRPFVTQRATRQRSTTSSRLLSTQTTMRIPAQLLFLGSLLIPTAYALHESEVGLVDWHKTQIGVPLTHHHGLAPVFHRVDAGRNGSKSVVVSATQSNVLAAVDVVDGSVGT